MSEHTPLPIDRAPSGPRLTPQELVDLNLALARAQLAEKDAVIAQAHAREAVREFVALRAQISEAHGVALGSSHLWDQRTGEIQEARES